MEKDEALAQAESQIAKETKLLILKLNAWRYLISWASSFPSGMHEGFSGVDVVLTSHQSSELGFYHNEHENPENFIFFAQPDLYECLINVGVEGFVIEEDGVTLYIAPAQIFEFYIAGKAIKVKASAALAERLRMARKYAKYVQIGLVEGAFDPVIGLHNWSLVKLTNTIYPAEKQLNLLYSNN